MRKPMNKIMPLMMAAAVAATNVPVYPVLAEDVATGAKEYAVNMKVSYHDFYEVYGVDTLKDVTSADYVDAFSSATITKASKNGFGGIAAGTYHVPDFDSDDKDAINAMIDADQSLQVEGVNIPVVVTKDEKDTLIKAGAYTEKDFYELDNGTYQKTEISQSRQSAGKEISVTYTPVLQADIVDAAKVVSSSAISADAVKLSKENENVEKVTADVELSVGGRWGDYQFNLTNGIFADTLTKENAVVYGVIANTSDNNQYAMFAQENIWNVTELAWSVANSKRSEAYASTAGKTVIGFTYITSKGVYNVDIADTYLPIISYISAKAENPTVAADTVVNVTLKDKPEDFVPAYSLSSSTATISGTTATASGASVTIGSAVPGNYTLNITDASGKYYGTSTSFTVKGSKVSYNNGLTMEAQGADSIANYIKNITSVKVATSGAVTYLPVSSGSVNHYVSANIFKEDGTVNEAATYNYVEAKAAGRSYTYTVVSSGEIFEDAADYNITVSATGYEDVTFTYKKGAPVTPAPAEKIKVGTIATVSKLKYKVTKNSSSSKTATVTGVSSKTLKNLTIPATVKIKGETFKVTAIGNNAFKNCTKATKVTIGKNVTEIGFQCFLWG